MVVHTSSPDFWEAEAGRSQDQGVSKTWTVSNYGRYMISIKNVANC